ncbi:NitT/TauT family transport system permease protein [Ilumatobacter fluminis]|uniref:NitT/TauT family transport system permease protein n=1 Tax=Ilumatobacter fluminis TaxID=467091 RepID=A0A4R7I0W6_9ACTN|nr:ABC transporter permease [Ilumatobacter fluminis]TDT16499.1 NitT/TauT family transport system permease protein [Ilumatobacter fluminis]
MTTDSPAHISDATDVGAVPAGAGQPMLPPKAAGRSSKALSKVAGPLIGLAVFVGIWYFMHYWVLENVFDKPSFLITEPHRVIKDSFFDSVPREQMLTGLGWTTMIALIGLGISIVLGMTIAVLMAQSTLLEGAFWPYLIAAQAVPILAIVPILGSIFGFGYGSRVLVCVIISIFPIVSNTLFGLLSAEKGMHDLFTLHRASRTTRLFKLQFPAALPAIFAGFRIAAGLSVIGAVVGELFFRRGSKGIGILMDQYRSRNLYPLTYGALILSSLLGIAVFVFFGWLSKVAIGKWHETSRTGT